MKRKIRLLILSVFLFPFIAIVILDSSFCIVQSFWQQFYRTYIDDQKTFYIYALGESTALGVHYGEKTAPAQLVSYQFNDSLQGKSIHIISLAESGQTIEFCYFKFYFETLIRPHQNALLLIYSGINENIENEPDSAFRFWQLIQHSTTLSKFAYMFQSFRNSPQKYEYRYLQLVKRAKDLGCKTVISQLVGNIKDFDPEIDKGDILLSPAYKSKLIEANVYAEKEEWKNEEAILLELQNKLSNEHAYLSYRMGQCKLKQLQFDSAATYLFALPETNKYLGYAAWKNKILERVANQKEVALARTYDRFMDSSEHKLVGFNLIDDAHHPNLKGYSIMSEEVSQKVAALTGDAIKKSISPEDIIRHFSINNKRQYSAYYNLTEWYMYEILKTELPQSRLNRMKYYMEKYKTFNPNDETPLLWEMFVSIFEKNDSNFTKSLLAISKSSEKNELIEKMNRAFADDERKRIIISKAKQLKITDRSVHSTYALLFK